MNAEKLATRFARRFPVKVNGITGAFTWYRGDREPSSQFEPMKSTRGGRRNDAVSWCMWAYHAALGDTVELRTIVRGQHRSYTLKATPEEGRGYLEWLVARPGFHLGRETARQWLEALNKIS